jgi:hypothetical protein
MCGIRDSPFVSSATQGPCGLEDRKSPHLKRSSGFVRGDAKTLASDAAAKALGETAAEAVKSLTSLSSRSV